MEVTINSTEEMCDLMCNNQLPKSKPKKDEYWIFTFGSNHEHPGKYVKIRGSFNEARLKMFERYGDKWCFQYSEREWEQMKNEPHRYWEMETELGVIE